MYCGIQKFEQIGTDARSIILTVYQLGTEWSTDTTAWEQLSGT